MLKMLLALAVIKVGLFVALVVEQNADALQAAIDALSEALSSGQLNPIMAVVAGICAAGILVLKAFGKHIPLVDPLVKVVLDVAKKLTAKKVPPEATPGVAATVEVEKIGEPAPKADDK